MSLDENDSSYNRLCLDYLEEMEFQSTPISTENELFPLARKQVSVDETTLNNVIDLTKISAHNLKDNDDVDSTKSNLSLLLYEEK
jgi:hypothetical protein